MNINTNKENINIQKNKSTALVEKDFFHVCVKELIQNHYSGTISCTEIENYEIINKNEVIGIIKDTRDILFPYFFEHKKWKKYTTEEMLENLNRKLLNQVILALRTNSSNFSETEIIQQSKEICKQYILKLSKIQMMLFHDVEAALEGDPAATNCEEIIYSYPGFWATMVYRMAHLLYGKVPVLPRIMSEYVHSRTGIDINPGAEIDDYFFIDHGTGVVIGETAVIGKHVTIYQGVTLGAISTREGSKLKNKKRHPTIENDVVIYSGASVLGGDTVIGSNSVIGGNAFVTKSVLPGTRVIQTNMTVSKSSYFNN